MRQEIFVNEKVKFLKGRAKKNYFLAEQKKIADEVISKWKEKLLHLQRPTKKAYNVGWRSAKYRRKTSRKIDK